MAMNKKEQAAFEELKTELRLARAMRFTEPVEPDIPIPNGSILTKGFMFNAYHGIGGDRVVRACSSAVGHGFDRDDRADTKMPRRLYSSRLLALKAMRHSVEEDVAQRLANIDAQIEAELAKGPATP